MQVRDTQDGDIAAVHAIFCETVRDSIATFETELPAVSAIRERFERMRREDLPHLVAEIDGGVAGYALADRFRPRPGYRFTVEHSIYVAADRRGQGVGRALLGALCERCRAAGFREMVAVIGAEHGAQSNASIALHAALGFDRVGALRNVGFKFDRFLDTVYMQRSL